VRRCLPHLTFSHFSRTPICDRHTDRQTLDHSIYRVGVASRGERGESERKRVTLTLTRGVSMQEFDLGVYTFN